MKRLFCVFLILALLCTCLPAGALAAEKPAAEAVPGAAQLRPDALSRRAFLRRADLLRQDAEEIDYTALQRGVEYALAQGCEVPPLPEQEQAPHSALRGEPEDNLAMPGPLMDGMNASKDGRYDIRLIRYQTGKPNQYQTVLIYKGNGTNGDPVMSRFTAFSSWIGMAEGKEEWYPKNASLGIYTLVTCTTELVGDRYYVVDNTAFAQTFQVVNYTKLVTEYYIADENGKRVDKLVLDGSDYGYFQVLHWPKDATYTSDIDASLYLGNIGQVQECSGLVIITPEMFGWSQLALRFWSFSEVYLFADLEICSNKAGHRAEKTTLRTPSEFTVGAEMYYCPDCHASQIVTSDTFETVLYRLGDVKEGEWYYDYVSAAVLRGLFNGVSKYYFKPNDFVTRAMLVTVLWRYAGSVREGTNTFTDVKAGQWYTDAVAWAAKNHIVDGVGGGKFDPDGKITREQMAAILYRYANSIGADTSARGDLSSFADSAKVSTWALDAMQWCVAEGFIGGMQEGGSTVLDPQGSATRAQVCAILMRFIGKVDPSAQVLPLDPTGAEASGTYENDYLGNTDWAFFPDGTLVLAGNATMPDRPTSSVSPRLPWDAYKDRVTSIRLLNGMLGVGEYTFQGYSHLESLELPDSLCRIDNYAFSDCAALKTVRWPESDLMIGTSAFSGCTGLTALSFPTGLRFIGDDTFSGCTGVKSVALPETLAILGSRAFSGCASLETISLPDSLCSCWVRNNSSIGVGVFEGCKRLKTVNLPVGMSELTEGFFRGCSALEAVELPKGMSRIRKDAFSGCTSLKTLTLPASVCFLCDEAFDACGLTDLYICSPYLQVIPQSTASDETPVYVAPFGDPAKVTVHAAGGTEAEAIAQAFGFRFVPFAP